ncbi:MAG: glycosyltransferase, partial [Gemmatimonadetes bacterium]|nr:glycosyltransferase [Gemmatimonadota bacterium]
MSVPPKGTQPRILIHGVSVGEVNAAAPLVDALATGAPPADVVVSASTTTGFRRATEQYGGRNPVVRFPFDLTWMVDRFLDRIDPDAVVLMEQELWPGFLRRCEARGVPVVLVNARMSKASFGRYRRLGLLSRRLLRRLALVVCQSEAYRQQFEALGVPPERTAVVGSLKWDAARPNEGDHRARDLAHDLGIDSTRPLVVAGSTGPGEEALLLAGRPEGVQLLFAPRRPERWDEVALLVPGMPRRSGGNGDATTHPAQVFLLDTIGELNEAYRLADAVFVGRSLVPQGGSNPLEPAGLGKPAVIGPHHENFRDVVDILVAEGGLVVSDDPMAVIRGWMEDA